MSNQNPHNRREEILRNDQKQELSRKSTLTVSESHRDVTSRVQQQSAEYTYQATESQGQHLTHEGDIHVNVAVYVEQGNAAVRIGNVQAIRQGKTLVKGSEKLISTSSVTTRQLDELIEYMLVATAGIDSSNRAWAKGIPADYQALIEAITKARPYLEEVQEHKKILEAAKAEVEMRAIELTKDSQDLAVAKEEAERKMADVMKQLQAFDGTSSIVTQEAFDELNDLHQALSDGYADAIHQRDELKERTESLEAEISISSKKLSEIQRREQELLARIRELEGSQEVIGSSNAGDLQRLARLRKREEALENELRDSQQQKHTVQTLLTTSERRVEELLKRNQTLQTANADAESRMEELLKTKIRTFEGAHEEVLRQVTTLNKEKQTLAREKSSYEHRIDVLETDIESLKAANADARSHISDLEARIQTLSAELEQKKQELAIERTEASRLHAETERLNDLLKQSGANVSQHSSELDRISKVHQRASLDSKRRIDELEKVIQELKRTNGSAESRIGDLEMTNKTLMGRSTDDSRRLEEMERRNESLQKMYAESQKLTSKLQDEKRILERTISESQHRFDRLTEQMNALHIAFSAEQQRATEVDSKNQSLERAIIDANRRAEEAARDEDATNIRRVDEVTEQNKQLAKVNSDLSRQNNNYSKEVQKLTAASQQKSSELERLRQVHVAETERSKKELQALSLKYIEMQKSVDDLRMQNEKLVVELEQRSKLLVIRAAEIHVSESFISSGSSSQTELLSVVNQALEKARVDADRLPAATGKLSERKMQHPKGVVEVPKPSEISTTNHRVAETFFATYDVASGSEMLELINEINQQAMALAVTSTSMVDFKPGFAAQRLGVNHVALCSSLSGIVGPRLADFMMKTDVSKDPSIVELAVQSVVSCQLKAFLNCWPLGEKCGDITGIWMLHDAIYEKEPQSVSSRWRALASTYLRTKFHADAKLLEEQVADLIRTIVDVLYATGSAQSKTELFGLFQTDLKDDVQALLGSAATFAAKAKESVLSTEYSVIFVDPGNAFDDRIARGEGSQNLPKAGAKMKGVQVLCTTDLGLRSTTNDGKWGDVHRESIKEVVVSKATVVFAHEFSELLGSV